MRKKALLPLAKGVRRLTFGGKLEECKRSLQDCLNRQGNYNLSLDWHTSDPYNAGQAVTLLSLSDYSFKVSVNEEGYYFLILTSTRPEVRYINIEPIEQETDRIQFEQGRLDALHEILNDK